MPLMRSFACSTLLHSIGVSQCTVDVAGNWTLPVVNQSKWRTGLRAPDGGGFDGRVWPDDRDVERADRHVVQLSHFGRELAAEAAVRIFEPRDDA